MQNETVTFWVYELKMDVLVEDWMNTKDPGSLTKPETKIVARNIIDDCSDNMTIGGTGKDGVYYQFDSYEAYYAAGYFAERFDTHGLYIDCHKVDMPMDVLVNHYAK